MRLKLSIERHSLPPVKTIWPLTVAQQSWTIAQLLEHINQTFPLEGDHWGLEDYIVTLAGFECIHHHEVSTVCKDEDELVIRPLQTVEHRARTLSGRHQISENGRHLIDGVAFGKPALRGPERPDVRIPPRKRRKIDEAEDQNKPTVLLLENGLTTTTENNEVDEDSEDDSDFAEAEDSESEESDSVEDEDDEEGNEDDSESDSDGSSEDDSSSSDSSESDDSSAAAQKTLTASDNPKTVKFQDQQTVEITPAQQRNALDALKAAYEPPTPPRGLPFQGSTMTKDRNNRRRLKSRLNWLKQQGELPETATFADLATYDGTSASRIDETAELARRQKALLEAIASGGIDVNDKQLLSTQPADTVDDDEPPEQMSSKHPPVDAGAEVAAKPTSAPTNTIPAALIPAAVTRRAKLDLAGSKRLLFGSLGVKVPTTDADKDNTRSKLANGNGVKKAAIPEVTQPVQQAVEDWQSKINLSAVECWDEGVVLSAPSFPFVQHWDPQYPPRGKKRKRQPSYVETYDKYNITANGDYLDYDGTAEDDEYWEEGALLGDDAESDEQDFDGFDEAVDDGFPPVPDDINTCQELAEADAAVGDFVVYTTMDCSAATGWKPAFLMKTIKLLEKGDGRWKVQMAQRDLPAKEYDDDGQRVFKKFEMSEETEDDAIERFMAWEEFGAAPRLLLRSA